MTFPLIHVNVNLQRDLLPYDESYKDSDSINLSLTLIKVVIIMTTFFFNKHLFLYNKKTTDSCRWKKGLEIFIWEDKYSLWE